MAEPIDWLQLNKEYWERGQRHLSASVAIEQIIGEDVIRQAVDYCVALRPEWELAEGVMRALRPWSAMQRCYEIYHSRADIEVRRTAVGLLSYAGDARALEWIEEFLTDPDPGIQNEAINVLDLLLFGGGIQHDESAMEKTERLLDFASRHPNLYVRQGATALLAQEARRKRPGGRWRRSHEPSSSAAKRLRRERPVDTMS